MILSGIVEKIRNRAGAFLKSICILALIISSAPAAAQEFGGNPPSLKWKQFNTGLSRVIFPTGLDSQALEVSHLIDQMARHNAQSLGSRYRKIDVVLQNQTTLSNGYVSLGPFRSEFYLTPRQNSFELGSLPWHKSLALHEYRHVQQYNSFRTGLSKLFYYVFGEEGQSLANSMAIPDWFWEGDAVYQETVLSRQGRGRIPYFFNGYRSLWASGKDYSWMKLRNGSYRDFIPDHYALGYLLVNYGYHKFGDSLWNRVNADAAAFRPLVYPFQQAVRKHTAKSFRQFRREAFQHYSKSPHHGVSDSASRYASRQRHFTSDELYPQWIDNNHLLFLKSSYSEIPAFYVRNILTGRERKIRNKAVSTATYFSYNNGRLVYSSFVPDARWGWKNFEVLTVVDINTGKEKRISSKTRYLSPDISKDGKWIAAVQASQNGQHLIHVLDAETGKLAQEMPNPESYVYTYPKFYNNDSVVAAVRNDHGEMALGKFSIHTGFADWLTPFSIDVIAFPMVYKDTVFFSKTAGEQDRMFAATGGNILEFIPAGGESATGSYLLSANGGLYAWSTFTSVGYKLFTGAGHFNATATSRAVTYPMSEPPVEKDMVSLPASSPIQARPYPAAYRLFNFHSWRPYFSDPDYSYSLISNNILNTLQSEVYFTYNRNERFKETGASLIYGGWYLMLSGGASFTFDRIFRDSAANITWNEFNARVGTTLPLQFTRGTFMRSLNFGTFFNTKQVYYTGASKESFNDKRFNYGEFSLSAVNQQLRARQHIFPRFAQTFSARYRRILNNYTANQLLLNASIYLPGLFTNHHFVVQAAYQHRDTMQQYSFSNSFPFSRGYPDFDYPKMWKLGLNYHFPLFYPDAGFGNIAYLLRVRSNIFYDFSRIKSLQTGDSFDLDAAGVEIYFDTRWWNQLPVSFGIRYSRLFDAGLAGVSPNQWEIVLPMNLLSR